jgi:hypothetical protein
MPFIDEIVSRRWNIDLTQLCKSIFFEHAHTRRFLERQTKHE